MKKKIDEEMLRTFDDLEKMKAIKGYVDVIEAYNINNLFEDIQYILGSSEQAVDIMTHINTNLPKNLEEVHRDVEEQYWVLKYIANLVTFINTMKPITRHINPTDEDKAKFVEFIKKMEESDEN